jgi:hypothetical protein
LSEQVLDDEHFLRQCMDIEGEREMFFDGLEEVPRGLCVCVFDGSDRIQHTFWRYLDEEHPARPAKATAALRSAGEDMYQRMDELVGRTIARCQGDDTLLMVISENGFNSFRRGIDLNRWLREGTDNRRNCGFIGARVGSRPPKPPTPAGMMNKPSTSRLNRRAFMKRAAGAAAVDAAGVADVAGSAYWLGSIRGFRGQCMQNNPPGSL